MTTWRGCELQHLLSGSNIKAMGVPIHESIHCPMHLVRETTKETSGRCIWAALALQPDSNIFACKTKVRWSEDDKVTKTWMGDDIRDNSLRIL